MRDAVDVFGHQGTAAGAVARAARTDGPGHGCVLLLWLGAVAVPRLDSAVLPAQLSHAAGQVGAVRVGRVLRRRARRLDRRVLLPAPPPPPPRPGEGAGRG